MALTAMPRRHKPLPLLQDSQAAAAEPGAHASLSASAGTGKTHVLTARVLRLLLGGAAPEHILCLTFTRAGAAEMANRIHARLASWVRLKDADLGLDLSNLGEDVGPGARERARRLFARVLDAPGGLRIQTIHSFAQTLLAAFPAEAGIAPGFRPIEEREEQLLARRTLAALLEEAERSGDEPLIADVQALSLRLGERGAEDYLKACAKALEPLAAIGSAEETEQRLRDLYGLPSGDIASLLARRCADGSFDCDALGLLSKANRAWGTATGAGYADAIDSFLAAGPGERAAMVDLLSAVVTKKDGELNCRPGQLKADPSYRELAEALAGELAELRRLRDGARLAAIQAAGLRAGRAFAEAYATAKRSAGMADFDDLIRWTRRLFATPGMGDWVRFKLDRRTDHILIDEAQDTNADQWAIVDALADEYFAVSPKPGEPARTLFMVGDFKQAIFGFQGTNPREFKAMVDRVRSRSEALREAAREVEEEATPFRELSIDASFRSPPAVLEVVDQVIRTVGHTAMGLDRPPNRHVAHSQRPGRVSLLRPFAPAGPDGDDDAGEESWLDEPVRLYAAALARQVRQWLADAPPLASTGRPLAPGDILILVRSRTELASLIVARLYKEGVPVAGIDRLHLSEPFAVRDLLAAVSFAVQPLDDLNLANLLVSPLIGWNQDQLYDLAAGRGRRALWLRLTERAGEGGHLAEARDALGALLAIADFTTPSRFLETILSGPLDGRRKLLRRLGLAARDPIDELMSSALAFEASEIASLDRFRDWFERGEVEIKREQLGAGGAVRVMTVHGAKGLEAPLVILADATADPEKAGGQRQMIHLPLPGDGGKAPLIRPRSKEMLEPLASLAAEEKMLDLEEHWRLLYVGLTRAADWLVVGGVQKGARLPAACWHGRVEQALAALGCEWGEDPLWGARLDYRGSAAPAAPRPARPRPQPPSLARPRWLDAPAPAETRPPRPLAPSQITEDRDPGPPPSPAQRAAARRGTLLHALFERLPDLPPAERREAALLWLERFGGVSEAEVREEIAAAACGVIGDPSFARLFSPDSLAEAPIAATLPDGRVVAGTVDRLLVEQERVTVVDFKTGRQVPANAGEVPAEHAAQMRAYAEALRVIFPGRAVSPALLYTAAPRLIPLTG